jgi:hypothetical protein
MMSHYKGRVSGYTPRTEGGVFRKRQTLVWDFRMERHDPSAKPLPRVAVEMRAKYYRGGSISNGDVVEVWGRQSRSGVVVVRSVRNLTAGTVIRAHNWNASVAAAYLMALLVVAAIAMGGLYLAFGPKFLSTGTDGGHIVSIHQH